MLLCAIRGITKHRGDDNTPTVIVLEFVGGDRWGCKPQDEIIIAGGAMVQARDLSVDDRIWLNIHQMVSDGTFQTAVQEETN